MQKRSLLIAGGAGFVGSHLVKHMVEKYPMYDIHVIDSLTQNGNKKRLKECEKNITFHKIDIRDKKFIDRLFLLYDFEGVINLAAETPMDRSIEEPKLIKIILISPL